jgi:hypothetical protein
MAINDSSVRVTTGAHDEYEWLTTRPESIRTLLRACPEVVLGKYVAITSFDSGPLPLNEDDKSLGWESRRGVAYSPKIQSVEKLPFENYGEWYVFSSAFELGQVTATNVLKAPLPPGDIAAFVNYGGFRVHAQDVPEMQDLIELFWRQLELIHPESYIADGDLLNFVSRNKDLFASVRKAFA